jgi:hypothetical protein
MATAQPFPQARSLTAIGVSLAVHVLLVGAWQLSRPVKWQDDDEPQRVQYLRLLPAPAAMPDRPDRVPPSPAPATRQRAVETRPQRVEPAQAVPTPGTIALPAPPMADAAPAPSSTDLLRDARAAVGAIDRALRAENPARGIQAPVETRQMKLEKGIARAAELAPNKWYQAPKVEEILDPGGYGRRRYRVVGAAGTYCVTYESNHAPDGLDTMRDGIKPKFTNCDEDEQPATKQKWK